MVRARTLYICQSCGGTHPKWVGKCEHCGAWNTLAEEVSEAAPNRTTTAKGRPIALEGIRAASPPLPRFSTGSAELDRVLGGADRALGLASNGLASNGFVPGSAVLIGGDPGIGKSTLLLQTACKMAQHGRRIAYFSGEESTDQIRLRAERLGLTQRAETIGLAAATDVATIIATINTAPKPDMVIIDSIQTMYVSGIDSSPGSVTQVRSATHALIRHTRKQGIVLLIVGHVTKEGAIAGPKVLEHMVDTVLQFEGDRGHHFRILRGVKNRFGATDEIGVFEMTQGGLMEVANPSALFLTDRSENISGAVVFAGIEGTRPLLVEIQALVAPSSLAYPRRNVVGWDQGRLSMLAAVLEARAGVPLSGRDIFLNVAGGVKISEPAADLAVAAALISSISGKPCPEHTVFFGEVSLAAEVRRVAHTEQRLKEAEKLGFAQAILPKGASKSGGKSGLKQHIVASMAELIEILG